MCGYCTACHLESDRYSTDLPQPLWSNDPFDAATAERHLPDRDRREVSARPDAGRLAR